jgi:hypothetical protein
MAQHAHSVALPVPMTNTRKAHLARLRFLAQLWSQVQIDTPEESRARDSVARQKPRRADARLRTA